MTYAPGHSALCGSIAAADAVKQPLPAES